VERGEPGQVRRQPARGGLRPGRRRWRCPRRRRAEEGAVVPGLVGGSEGEAGRCAHPCRGAGDRGRRPRTIAVRDRRQLSAQGRSHRGHAPGHGLVAARDRLAGPQAGGAVVMARRHPDRGQGGERPTVLGRHRPRRTSKSGSAGRAGGDPARLLLVPRMRPDGRGLHGPSCQAGGAHPRHVELLRGSGGSTRDLPLLGQDHGQGVGPRKRQARRGAPPPNGPRRRSRSSVPIRRARRSGVAAARVPWSPIPGP
jgi:hypothetical protein